MSQLRGRITAPLRRCGLAVFLSWTVVAATPLPAQDGAASEPLPEPPQQQDLADFVRVHKGARTLEVWSGNRLLLTLSGIQLGRAPLGPKQFDGDGRTPEGRYLIDWRNPHSAYHLSLHISYPHGRQVAAAAAQGRGAGGMVMIHGQPNEYDGRVRGDWTDGCIALSDVEIETLWSLVPDGAVIEILP